MLENNLERIVDLINEYNTTMTKTDKQEYRKILSKEIKHIEFVLGELCHLTDREYILMFSDDLETLENAIRKIKT